MTHYDLLLLYIQHHEIKEFEIYYETKNFKVNAKGYRFCENRHCGTCGINLVCAKILPIGAPRITEEEMHQFLTSYPEYAI